MKHDICLNGPIPSWDEGLPLGNGGMGCLIWGPLHALRFSMDLAGLWDLTPALQTKRPDFTYQTMCRLVRQQSWAELQSLFDAPYACAAPTKLPVGAFELAGLPEQAYSARLSLQDATAELQSGAHRLRVWLAATCAVRFPRLAIRRRSGSTKMGCRALRKKYPAGDITRCSAAAQSGTDESACLSRYRRLPPRRAHARPAKRF